MADRLSKLKIDELSGVENPANELPGWLVLKAKSDGEPDLEDLSKQVDQMEANFAILYSALQACTAYLTDADPAVQQAATTLAQYIEQLFSGESDGDPSTDATGTPAAAAPAPAAASTQVHQSKDKGSSILKRLLGGRKEEPEETDTTKTDTQEKNEPVADEADTKTEKTDKAEVEETPAAKSDETKDAILKAIGELGTNVAAQTTELGESVDTVKTALGAALDRISSLEAGRQGHTAEDLQKSVQDDVPAEGEDLKKQGQAYLRGTLVSLAKNPNTSAALG